MTLSSLITKYKSNQKDLNWIGSFEDYLKIVEEDPKVTRLIHARVYDMIMEYGIEENEEGEIIRYKFFDGEIFGCRETINSIMEYLRAGKQRKESRKRILLLMGGAGSGKSTIATLLKKGLEKYTKIDEGALYGIMGCPMHEEPLHLVPDELRKQVQKEYGVYIEGDLCPLCQWRLKNEWGYFEEKNGKQIWVEDLSKVHIERVIFSELERKGIGTFSPSDKKTQDISELVGSMDLAEIGKYGSESDPRAYRFDGEINVSSRGIMEFIEMLKCNHEFLYVLLNLAQEQRFKVGRFSLIYSDTMIIAHTNEAEYLSFISEAKNEALKDRTRKIEAPYNLTVNDEEKIHDKLLAQGDDYVHLAPNTTKVAAMFAVLTRLENDLELKVDDKTTKKFSDLVDKMKAYNGEKVKNWTDHEVKLMKKKHEHEGLSGISPRFITDALSNFMTKPNVKCLNPIDALRGLKEHLDHHPGINKDSKEKYKTLIGQVREVYHEILKKQVMSAFVIGYSEQAKSMVDRYIREVNGWKSKNKIKDPITNELREPDEKLMRSIEEQIGVAEPSKKEFREEIAAWVMDLIVSQKPFDYTTHNDLKEAVQKKLFNDVKPVVKSIISANAIDNIKDKEQHKKLDQVVESLKQDGYCEHCSREVLRYVSTFIE